MHISKNRLQGLNTHNSVVQECSRSPSQVSADRDAANVIRQQEEDLLKLRDQVSVLAHAKETDGRRFRHIATERHRERQDLKAELDRLKVFSLQLSLCQFCLIAAIFASLTHCTDRELYV